MWQEMCCDDEKSLDFLRVIFRGEPDEKIIKISNVFSDLGIYASEHLPLALDDVNAHPEIQEADKRKIRRYVMKYFKDEYYECREYEKQLKQSDQEQKQMDQEVSMRKHRINKCVYDSMSRYKQQLLSHDDLYSKALTEAKKVGFFTWKSTRELKISNLQERINDNDEEIKNIEMKMKSKQLAINK